MKNLSLTVCLGIAAFFGSVGSGFALPICNHTHAYGTISDKNGKVITTGFHACQSPLLLSEGDLYNGEFRYGTFHGKGTYTFGIGSKKFGEKYIGNWRSGKFHGEGIYIFRDGTKKEGIWKNGVFENASAIIHH